MTDWQSVANFSMFHALNGSARSSVRSESAPHRKKGSKM